MAKKRTLTRYTTYPFTEQDPIIGILYAVKRNVGMSDEEISAKTRLARSTPAGWWVGKVKRPQFASIAATAVAFGLTELPLTPDARAKFRAK